MYLTIIGTGVYVIPISSWILLVPWVKLREWTKRLEIEMNRRRHMWHHDETHTTWGWKFSFRCKLYRWNLESSVRESNLLWLRAAPHFVQTEVLGFSGQTKRRTQENASPGKVKLNMYPVAVAWWIRDRCSRKRGPVTHNRPGVTNQHEHISVVLREGQTVQIAMRFCEHLHRIL